MVWCTGKEGAMLAIFLEVGVMVMEGGEEPMGIVVLLAEPDGVGDGVGAWLGALVLLALLGKLVPLGLEVEIGLDVVAFVGPAVVAVTPEVGTRVDDVAVDGRAVALVGRRVGRLVGRRVCTGRRVGRRVVTGLLVGRGVLWLVTESIDAPSSQKIIATTMFMTKNQLILQTSQSK